MFAHGSVSSIGMALGVSFPASEQENKAGGWTIAPCNHPRGWRSIGEIQNTASREASCNFWIGSCARIGGRFVRVKGEICCKGSEALRLLLVKAPLLHGVSTYFELIRKKSCGPCQGEKEKCQNGLVQTCDYKPEGDPRRHVNHVQSPARSTFLPTRF